jgi:hypothetical protein
MIRIDPDLTDVKLIVAIVDLSPRSSAIIALKRPQAVRTCVEDLAAGRIHGDNKHGSRRNIDRRPGVAAVGAPHGRSIRSGCVKRRRILRIDRKSVRGA